MEQDTPPPPPPPHGSNPRPPGGLPDGNYDIFIIPPHSAGSGFLYLPSMTPNRNSFLAGVACTLVIVGLYTAIVPTVKQWMHSVQSGGGGLGVLTLVVLVGVGAWAVGKTQAEGASAWNPENGNGAGASGRHQRSQNTGPPPNNWQQAPPPPPPPQPDSPPNSAPKPNGTASGWEKAREETRRREEERKRAEELKKKREEAAKMREEAERAAKAKAEKDKWEQARAREKETREREARERIAREREQRLREQRERDTKEQEARGDGERKKTEWEKARQAEKDKADRIRAAAAASTRSDPTKPTTPSSRYEKPTARSAAYTSSASSVSGLSESSYAPSMSTARTTPPPSHRGPYKTSDPDKIRILTVALFSDSSPSKPISQLVANEGPVTDGLILNIRTAGLFIDDDVRGVPQREWDVKAWTLKLIEDGMAKLPGSSSLHVVRATTRDTENKKYCFILEESEAWKVAVGLQRLRKGSQVRSLGMNGMKDNEVKGLLATLGFI